MILSECADLTVLLQRTLHRVGTDRYEFPSHCVGSTRED